MRDFLEGRVNSALPWIKTANILEGRRPRRPLVQMPPKNSIKCIAFFVIGNLATSVPAAGEAAGHGSPPASDTGHTGTPASA